jgi:phage terminase small subunit
MSEPEPPDALKGDETRRGGPVASDRPLTARQRRFIEEYLIDLNGTQAAIRAGYSPKTARFQAARLLTNANIQAALEAADAERRERTGVTPERVLRDIDSAANLDIGELFDERKQLRSIHDMPLHVRRAIVSIEVVKRNLTSGDGTMEYVYKVKLIDKGRMHELLAKYTGLVDGERVDKPADVPAFALPPETPGVAIH